MRGLRIFKLWLCGVFLVQCCMFILRSLAQGLTYSHIRRIHTIMTIQSLMLGFNLVVYKRCYDLIKSSYSGFLNRMCKSLLVLFLALAHASYAFHFVFSGREPTSLSYICFACTGFSIHLFSLLIASSIAEYVLGKLARSQVGHLWLVQKCPKFLNRLLFSYELHSVLAICLSLFFAIFGLHVTSKPPNIYTKDLYFPNLPTQFTGFKIALLTDLHIGPTVGRNRIEQIVNLVNFENVDIIAISGDLVDGSVQQLHEAAEPLQQLQSKYSKTVFSTGNHEYYHGDINAWLIHLSAKLGVTPLHNSHIKLHSHKGNTTSEYICFAGVDDISAKDTGIFGHGLNLSLSLQNCSSQNHFTVLLSHQPKGASFVLNELKSGDDTKVDLILSGHTHGGQFYVLAPLAYLVNAFYLGHYIDSHSNTQVFVSAGVNFWGPPMKMSGLCEIPILRLNKGT